MWRKVTLLDVKVMQVFIMKCKEANIKPTWEELRKFKLTYYYKKRAAEAAKVKNSTLL